MIKKKNQKTLPVKNHQEVTDLIAEVINDRRRVKKAEYEKLVSEAVFSGKVPDRLNALKSKGALEELDQLSSRIQEALSGLYTVELTKST